MNNSEFCIVMTTFSDDEVGKKMIESLINKKLAACVQVQKVNSYYHWKGSVNNDEESLVMIKTLSSLYTKVEEDILFNHNYETPEIIQIPIENGFNGYLDWIRRESNLND